MPEDDRTLGSERVRTLLGRARVLYTDLDGTLLGRGGSILADETGEWTTETASAVVDVNRARVPVVMVSGRNVKQLLELARALGWQDFIAEVGCVIVHGRGREVLYDIGEWPEDAIGGRTPYEAIADAGALELLQDAFPGLIEYHDPYHLDREATHVLRGELDVAAAQAVLDGLELPVAIVDNGVIHPMRHTLRDGIERIHAYHLMPKGASKHGAIAADLERRGLTREDGLAIGDSMTDLAMARSVGLLGVVRNALDVPAMAEAVRHVDNAVITEGRQGRGWAEFAHAWLAAREALG